MTAKFDIKAARGFLRELAEDWRTGIEDGTYDPDLKPKLAELDALLAGKTLRIFSVMLLYPKNSGEYGDTFYTSVEAVDRDEAVKEAIRECADSNDWNLAGETPEGEEPDYELDDFQELLVLEGQHIGI